MKTQVDVEAFLCNNSDGVASKVQGFEEKHLLKSKAAT